MKKAINLSLILCLFIFASQLKAQTNRADTIVLERNVRGQLEFLASDAMQGRGSGTIFEQATAEYLGSQMTQFGIEPAGDKDASGRVTFVQTVTVPGRASLESLNFGGVDGKLKLGQDIGVFAIGSATISGSLQRLKPDEKAKAGAIVLLMLEDNAKFDSIRTSIGQLSRDGAVAVIFGDTAEFRENWSDAAARRPPLGRGGNLFVLSTSGQEKFKNIPEGATIEISAKFGDAKSSMTWNAVGKITGSDPNLRDDVIVLSAHLDHLGMRPNAVGDDKIYNGADDDASGCVAVLELARYLADRQPKRTIYFAFFGSEEAGGHGSRHFVGNLSFPKEKLIANLQFEMIGRPDSKVKPDELWLTGFDLSDLGPALAKQGAKLVADPHPEENFFQRSDNYTLARQGIVAHTVSSFGLHQDYHKVTDELRTIDFGYMTRAIDSMLKPVEWLANSSFKPAWKEGKKP